MEFEEEITRIIRKDYPNHYTQILSESYLIRYLKNKTRSVNEGSKSRGSYANLYALYVLIEDYKNNNFIEPNTGYSDYNGASFSTLLYRMRELPFGEKIQNHALNHRLNEEFKKYFPEANMIPIIRDVRTQKYWINEELLYSNIEGVNYSLVNIILQIILKYVKKRQENFNTFIDYCSKLSDHSGKFNNSLEIKEFIIKQLQINSDARIFEIVAFSILKYYYSNEVIYWGWDKKTLNRENLKLYKTGRTNANDGGIDYVMKPLGRFFQVTETLDFKKYFLDLDKVQHFPIVFVIKTQLSVSEIQNKIQLDAQRIYKIKSVIDSYISCFEEIINIPRLLEILEILDDRGQLNKVLFEIKLQSQLEFNIYHSTSGQKIYGERA